MSSVEILDVTEYVCDVVGLRARVLHNKNDQAVRLHLCPWSRKGIVPQLGQIWRGKIKSKDPGGQGCLVNIGLEHPVYLQTNKNSPPEGAFVDIKIKSEQRWDKSAIAVLETAGSNLGEQSKIGLLANSDVDPLYYGVNVLKSSNCSEASSFVFEAIDQALSSSFTLLGGGSIHIDKTKALIAIDVDAGRRINKGSRSNFAFSANTEALNQICSAISLKSLGGLVVIDFLKMSAKNHNIDVQKKFQTQLNHILGRKSQVGNISQFGLLEASVAHKFSPIEFVIDSLGKIEWSVINMFKLIESEAKMNSGRFFVCRVSQDIHSWLATPTFDWKTSLIDRVGNRVEFEIDNDLSKTEYTIGMR